ncbi:MAG: porin family protein [Oligoflexia bacterium]|nr:porin family protein [Oligoflexia bacterium]
MKTNFMISPESSGKYGLVELGGGYQSAPTILITEDAAISPPDRSVSRVYQEQRIFFHGLFGLIKDIDVFLDPASWLSVKAQLIGNSRENAKSGNFSTSVIGSVWYEKDKGRGSDLDFKDGPNGKQLSVAPNVRYTKTASSYRVGLLSGYRIYESLLIYFGFSYQQSRYHGTYDLSVTQKGSFAGGSSSKAGHLGLQYEFSPKFLIRIEDSYSIVKIPAFGAKSSQHSLGLLLTSSFSLVD